MRRPPAPRPPGAAVALALALVAVALPPIARAASPSPAGGALPPSVQAWLDASFVPPPDVPPDALIEVGLTFWDTASKALVPVDGVFARLHPAKGKAAPTTGDAHADWPGHVVVDVHAPKGGPGSIEFGIHGPDGDHRLKLAGTGPPPDAPLADLVHAELLPIIGDVVAGRPFPLGVLVQPQGEWNIDEMTFPDRLVVSAAHPGGQELSNAELVPGGGPGTPYVGHLTIPETGDADLTFLVPGTDGADLEIPDSSGRVTVIQGGRSSPAANVGTPATTGTDGSSGDVPPVVWAGAIGLLAVGLLLVFGGSLFRRRPRGPDRDR